jgi:hypothetical protein
MSFSALANGATTSHKACAAKYQTRVGADRTKYEVPPLMKSVFGLFRCLGSGPAILAQEAWCRRVGRQGPRSACPPASCKAACTGPMRMARRPSYGWGSKDDPAELLTMILTAEKRQAVMVVYRRSEFPPPINPLAPSAGGPRSDAPVSFTTPA